MHACIASYRWDRSTTHDLLYCASEQWQTTHFGYAIVCQSIHRLAVIHKSQDRVCNLIIITPCACANAQRGKVIGRVVVVVVVVVSTKIARSRILGEFTSATCS